MGEFTNTVTGGTGFADISYLDPAFSGSDIVLSINGEILSSVQSISWSTNAEKSPIFTMGKKEYSAVVSGKRGTSGTLVLTQFSRDELIARYNKVKQKTNFAMNDRDYAASVTGRSTGVTLAEFDREMTRLHTGSGSDPNDNTANMIVKSDIKYEDELPPFDVTITFADGNGNVSQQSIEGISITSSATGLGVNTVVAEKAFVFIARGTSEMKEIKRNGKEVKNLQ